MKKFAYTVIMFLILGWSSVMAESLSLSGANYLSINSNLGITGTANSIACHVKLKAEISSGTWVFAYQTSGVSPYVGFYMAYDYNGGSRRIRFTRLKEGVAADSISYPVTMGTSNWFHVGQSFDGTTLKAYVDGVLVGSLASSGNGSSAYNDPKTMIGARWDGASNTAIEQANILVDDVGAFSRALSASEFLALKQNQLTGSENGILGSWSLNNSTGTMTNTGGATFSTDSPFSTSTTTTTTTTTTTNPVISRTCSGVAVGLSVGTSQQFLLVGPGSDGSNYLAIGETTGTFIKAIKLTTGYTPISVTQVIANGVASTTLISILTSTSTSYVNMIINASTGGIEPKNW